MCNCPEGTCMFSDTPIAKVMLCRREVTAADVERAKLAFLRHKERHDAAPSRQSEEGK